MRLLKNFTGVLSLYDTKKVLLTVARNRKIFVPTRTAAGETFACLPCRFSEM